MYRFVLELHVDNLNQVRPAVQKLLSLADAKINALPQQFAVAGQDGDSKGYLRADYVSPGMPCTARTSDIPDDCENCEIRGKEKRDLDGIAGPSSDLEMLN